MGFKDFLDLQFLILSEFQGGDHFLHGTASPGRPVKTGKGRNL